jgi:hypothetical protein
VPLLAVADQVISSQPPPRDRILGLDQPGASRMVRDA